MTNLLSNFCLTVISFGRLIGFRRGSGRGVFVLISHLASFVIRVVSFHRARPLAVSVLLGAVTAAAAAATATAPTTAGAAASTLLTTITCTGTVRAAAAAAAATATATQATGIAAGITSRWAAGSRARYRLGAPGVAGYTAAAREGASAAVSSGGT